MSRVCWLAALSILGLLSSGCGKASTDEGSVADANSPDATVNSTAEGNWGEAGDVALAVTADTAGSGYMPASGKSALKYRFTEGKHFAYRINVEAELGDKLLVTQSICNYTVGKKDTAQTPSEPATATGTAFVVHPDGYLLTCEHVVEGAQKLEIMLGGKKYAAKVITADEALDLAIIKVEARGLASLPLGNSAGVQVGQEVRAVGYPLSDVLGSSLKATRGSVSGIDQLEGHRTFQIDASVNGGNSGGPLVSEEGHVVGVVNAKLAGAAISNVGFAVPVDYAKRMLTDRKVSFSAAKSSARLDGPSLVKQVNPCVAFVTVTLGPDAAEETYNLRVAGHINRGEREKRSSPGRPNFGFGPGAGGNTVYFGAGKNVQLKVDSSGGVHEFDGTDSLPLMLGYAPLFIFEPLPTDGRRNWETTQQIMLESKSKSDQQRDEPGFGFGRSFGPRGPIGPRGPMGPRFGPRFGREPEPAQETKTYPAIETVKYTLDPGTSEMATITKHYELKTTSTASDTPQLHMTGAGTIAFDTKEGLPKKMDYKGTLNITIGQVSLKIPFTATYQLADPKPPAVASTPKPATQPAPDQSATAKPSPHQPQPNASATPRPAFPSRRSKTPPADPEFADLASNPQMAVRASGATKKEPLEYAFDGNLQTAWTGGGWPQHWLEADLKDSASLAAIKLTCIQTFPGETAHEVWISEKPLGHQRTDGKLIHTFQGATKTGDVLEFDFPAGTKARYVQVLTTKSRNWVAWTEVQIERGK